MMRRIQRIQQSAAYQRRMGRKGENSPKNSNTVIDDWSFQQFLQSTNYGESLSIHSPAAPERAAAAGGVFWPCRARTPGFDGMHDAWCRRKRGREASVVCLPGYAARTRRLELIVLRLPPL